MINVTLSSILNSVLVYNVSQRITPRMLKCSKQILLRELSQIVCSTSVSFHGWKAFRSTLSLNESDILVSYDVSSLFTNVPLDETIQILVEKAFKNNIIGSMSHTNWTSASLIWLNYCKWPLKISCSSLMEGYSNRLTVLQWVHP